MLNTITLAQLRDRLESANPPTLLEALPERYYADKHLPGALHFPHDQVDQARAAKSSATSRRRSSSTAPAPPAATATSRPSVWFSWATPTSRSTRAASRSGRKPGCPSTACGRRCSLTQQALTGVPLHPSGAPTRISAMGCPDSTTPARAASSSVEGHLSLLRLYSRRPCLAQLMLRLVRARFSRGENVKGGRDEGRCTPRQCVRRLRVLFLCRDAQQAVGGQPHAVGPAIVQSPHPAAAACAAQRQRPARAPHPQLTHPLR